MEAAQHKRPRALCFERCNKNHKLMVMKLFYWNLGPWGIYLPIAATLSCMTSVEYANVTHLFPLEVRYRVILTLCRKVPAKLIIFPPIFPKMADLAGCG